MSALNDAAREYVYKRHPQHHDQGVGIVQGSHYRAGFIAGAQWQAEQGPTDEQVEAAARGLYEERVSLIESDTERADWPTWEGHKRTDADEWRSAARTALRAAYTTGGTA